PKSSHETGAAFPCKCSTHTQTSPYFTSLFPDRCRVSGVVDCASATLVGLNALTDWSFWTSHFAAPRGSVVPSNISPCLRPGGGKTFFTMVGEPFSPIIIVSAPIVFLSQTSIFDRFALSMPSIVNFLGLF